MRRNGRVIPHYFGRLFMVRPHGDSYGVFRRRGNRKHSGRRIRRTRLPRAWRRRVGVKRGSGRTGLGSCWFARNFDMAPYVFVSACCGNCGNVHGRYVARAARHRFKAHVGGQRRARNGWGLTTRSTGPRHTACGQTNPLPPRPVNSVVGQGNI